MKPARRIRLSRSLLITLAGAAILLSPVAGPLAAQAPAATQAASPSPAQTEPAVAAKLSPKEIREAQIAADAQKLFQLAQELKVEVDKSTKDTLSLSVIKKSEEIEKLARTLKQEMRAN